VLGGIFGASCWLLFYEDLSRYIDRKGSKKDIEFPENAENGLAFVDFMIGLRMHDSESIGLTPIFLGHGLDDAYVDAELGRAAKDVLTKAGYKVEWREYEGADEEGHWFKEPEELIDIANFLDQTTQDEDE